MCSKNETAGLFKLEFKIRSQEAQRSGQRFLLKSTKERKNSIRIGHGITQARLAKCDKY